MDNQLAYSFASSQVADRFLNRLKAGAIKHVKARRYKTANSILVVYGTPKDATFDTTCQQLDDLAESLGGCEISVV